MTSPEQQVVLDLIEEDDYGLWEIGWQLRAEFGESTTVESMAAVTRGLLDQGWARLVVRDGPADGPRELEDEDPPIDLLDPAAWLAPGSDERAIWLRATDEGVAAYQAGYAAHAVTDKGGTQPG